MDGSKSSLALNIIGAIMTLRDNKAYANITKRTRCTEIEETINDFYDSNFQVIIDPSLSQNANVSIPRIAKDNPMWKELYRDWFPTELEETATKDLYRSSKDLLVGGINAKGKLTGYFRKLESTITISYDMLYSKASWSITPAGATGIIAHEIGHFMNYLKALGYTCRRNYVLEQTNSRLMGVGDRETRVAILEEIIDKEGLDIKSSAQELAKLNNDKTTATIIIGSSISKMRNELGSDIYDSRGFEALSDNFAAQHGLGLDLVIALDTMPSMRFVKRNTVERLLGDSLWGSIRMATLVLNPALSVIMNTLAIVLYNPLDKIYDDPRDRFKRVADNLILTMKANRDGDNKKLIADVEQIQSIMAGYHNNRGFHEAIYETFLPSGRDSKSLRELNQHLEDFSNNKLYLAAAKFQQLG